MSVKVMFSLMKPTDCHFKSHNKKTTALSIPSCHLSHKGNKLFNVTS